MRIAVVTDTYYPATDGVTRFVEKLAECLSEDGHQVSLLFPDFPKLFYPGEVPDIPKVKYVTLPCLPVPLHGYFWVMPNIQFFTEIAKADLVIFNSFGSMGIFGVPLAAILKKHRYLFIHHNEIELVQYAMDIPRGVKIVMISLALKLYKLIHRFAYATDKFRRKALKFNARPEQMFRVNFGVNPPELDSEYLSSLKERFGVSEKSRVFLYVGRFSGEKNIFKITETLGRLSQDEDNVCIMVGIGYLHQKVTELAEERGYRIHFTGRASDHTLWHIYRMSDFLVTPTFHESMCFTVVEGMSQGTIPVVNGQNKEKHLTPENCILVDDITDVEEMVRKLETVAADVELMRGMQHRAEETVKELTWEKFAEVWSKEISRLENGKSFH